MLCFVISTSGVISACAIFPSSLNRPSRKLITPNLPRNSPSGNGTHVDGGGGNTTPARKVKPMDNMSATSFFAQLVRQQHGPLPKEQSPSPPPVMIMETENANSSDLQIVSEVVTINDDDSHGSGSMSQRHQQDQGSGVAKTDSVDGEQLKSATEGAIVKSENNTKSAAQSSSNSAGGDGAPHSTGPSMTSLMQLPFPPGMDGIKNNVLTSTMGIMPGGLPNVAAAQAALYGNLSAKKNKIMSITKDLPMPPGECKCPIRFYLSEKN